MLSIAINSSAANSAICVSEDQSTDVRGGLGASCAWLNLHVA